ncbi:hypothetical protein MKW92_006665, partial [Papaver armeniacum]
SAGFGPFGVSVPSQLSLAFRIPRVFAMCLPSTTSSKGVIFVGGGPYKMQPGIDISTSLTYTPFYTKTNAFSNSEYYIQVTSINIGGEKILLDLNRGEYPSPKLATIDTLIPYTLIGTSIYNQFTSIFIEKAKAMNITRAASVAPFEVCFDSANLISTRVGALVPTINIVLHRDNVVWKIFGSNSMVRVSEEVSCLGFVDGGHNPSNMLVIGGYQLQDNLLEFNLAKRRLGFTSILGRRTTYVVSINGSTSGSDVTVRNFSLGCGSTSLLKGLAEGVKGMAGFGPFGVSVPSQLSLAFRIPRVFAMCLLSSTSSKGVIFIGGGPYIMQPGNDLSTSLTYTPFYTNPIAFSTSEYYIQVNSIKIGEEKFQYIAIQPNISSVY